MSGDCVADAGVSRPEREDERGRADARAKPVSGAFGDAERPEADVPPGLWQFARKQLREAYFHAARASVRDLELNPRPARDEDRVAADPPDPEPGVRRVLSAIRDLAVAAADVPAADDEYQTRSASNRSKRRKKKETRASTVCARFDADAKAAARRARADWRAAAALLLEENSSPPNVARRDAETEAENETETETKRDQAFTRRAVLAHLERAAESERRARWRTETITGRHSDLRRRASSLRADLKDSDFKDSPAPVASSFGKAFGNDATRAPRRVGDGECTSDDPIGSDPNVATSLRETWRAATGVSADAKDAAHALAYAEAAEETGRKPWVTEALRWCHDFTTRFLRGGGAAAFALKAERRRVFRETGARMTDAEAAARLRALSSGHLGMDGDPGLVPAKPETSEGKRKRPNAQLLDVGSCWDYFRAFENDTETYEVVALDLAPRTPRVFRCDFLELAITPEGSEMQTSVEKAFFEKETLADASSPFGTRPENPSPFVTTLRSYPAGRASAVVMSLVLSYLPCPRMRGEMVRRAREVLLDDGRGVLLIVTPHSTDRSYSGASRTNALAVWRENVERVGFERVAYERKKSVHCVAFRTVGAGPGAVRPGEAPPLPIAFDAKERETNVVTRRE